MVPRRRQYQPSPAQARRVVDGERPLDRRRIVTRRATSSSEIWLPSASNEVRLTLSTVNLGELWNEPRPSSPPQQTHRRSVAVHDLHLEDVAPFLERDEPGAG